MRHADDEAGSRRAIASQRTTRRWPRRPRWTLPFVTLALGACAASPATTDVAAPPLVARHANADPASVTSRAVEVLPGASLVFVSGQTPEPAAPQAPRSRAADWGDTEAQTRATLAKLERQLRTLGLSLADVVKLQVFLVGDPGVAGSADTAGFERAYAQRFGPGAVAPPARTVVQVAALGHPGARIEIDAVAVRPGPAARDAR
jgi:enamine deaminase RidA (YjgF/YER057c/UK114 family)